jgi:hypothetical protein
MVYYQALVKFAFSKEPLDSYKLVLVSIYAKSKRPGFFLSGPGCPSAIDSIFAVFLKQKMKRCNMTLIFVLFIKISWSQISPQFQAVNFLCFKGVSNECGTHQKYSGIYYPQGEIESPKEFSSRLVTCAKHRTDSVSGFSYYSDTILFFKQNCKDIVICAGRNFTYLVQVSGR